MGSFCVIWRVSFFRSMAHASRWCSIVRVSVCLLGWVGVVVVGVCVAYVGGGGGCVRRARKMWRIGGRSGAWVGCVILSGSVWWVVWLVT